MGRSRYLVTEPDKPHFLTCTVPEWLPLFTRPALRFCSTAGAISRRTRACACMAMSSWRTTFTSSPRRPTWANVSAGSSRSARAGSSITCRHAELRAAAAAAFCQARAQGRPSAPALAGRLACRADLQRCGDAGEARLHPSQPGQAGLRGSGRALALFQCAELCRTARADRGRPLGLVTRSVTGGIPTHLSSSKLFLATTARWMKEASSTLRAASRGQLTPPGFPGCAPAGCGIRRGSCRSSCERRG